MPSEQFEAEYPRWTSSLKVQVSLLVLLISLAGIGSLYGVFTVTERKLVSDFENEEVTLIENFVNSTLTPIMLTGQATLMASIVESYKELSNLEELKILRANGEEAFTDESTITEVNQYLGWEKFSREFAKETKQIIPADDETLRKVNQTSEKSIIKVKNIDGSYNIRMMIPIVNEESCHICHGESSKIRGILTASFSLTKIGENVNKNIYGVTQFAAIAILLLSLSMFFLFKGIVLNPISDIVRQINSIIKGGKYDIRVNAKSKNEIGNLASVLNSFIGAVEKYRHEQATEKDRLEAAVREKTKEIRDKNRIIEEDLKMAGRVQKRLLPERLPQIHGYKFEAKYIPSMHIGGDFYDVFRLKNGSFGIFIADATGHGSSAALLVTIVKTLLVASAEEANSPSALVKTINKYMATITPDDANVTLFYGIIEVETKKMTYCLAGHPPPIIFNPEENRLIKLDINGGLVGAFEESLFEDYEFELKSGDKLFAYTDGLVEPLDLENRYFGINRVISIIQENYGASDENLMAKMMDAVYKYTGGADLEDDVTMLMVDLD